MAITSKLISFVRSSVEFASSLGLLKSSKEYLKILSSNLLFFCQKLICKSSNRKAIVGSKFALKTIFVVFENIERLASLRSSLLLINAHSIWLSFVWKDIFKIYSKKYFSFHTLISPVKNWSLDRTQNVQLFQCIEKTRNASLYWLPNHSLLMPSFDFKTKGYSVLPSFVFTLLNSICQYFWWINRNQSRELCWYPKSISLLFSLNVWQKSFNSTNVRKVETNRAIN